MTTTLDRLTTTIAERQRDAQAAYVDLVREAADGADVDMADAQSVLAAAGKTTTDLSRDLGRLTARRAAAARMAEGQAAKGELAKTEAEAAKVRRRIEQEKAETIRCAALKAERDHATQVEPLERRAGELIETVRLADAARASLVETADPEARRQVEQLEHDLRALNDRATQARQQATERRGRVERAKAISAALRKDVRLRTAAEVELTNKPGSADPTSWDAAARRAGEEQAQYEREAQRLDEQAESAREKLRAAEAAMLTP